MHCEQYLVDKTENETCKAGQRTINENILGFEIAMDDRSSVYVHQSLNDLSEQSPALGGICL